MNPKTEEDRKQYHWYQNAQNMFWKSPIWEVDLGYDQEWNEALLEEIYDIGRNITLGIDANPSNSIWDYAHKYPHLKEIKDKIIDVVTMTITKEIPEIRMLNIKGCEHFMGWINVREPGESLEVHGHTESAIAATYYVKAKEGCGDIVLYDTAGAIDFENNRTTGSHLKAPVTKKPSTLKKGSKAYNRRKSFCARMSGVEGPMTKPNGEPTRKALALRKWNC